MTATLRGNVRKLRLPMCGGTPFAVVSIQGEIMNWYSGIKKTKFTDALKEGRVIRQGMQEMLSEEITTVKEGRKERRKEGEGKVGRSKIYEWKRDSRGTDSINQIMW